jgi:hypothetical protein
MLSEVVLETIRVCVLKKLYKNRISHIKQRLYKTGIYTAFFMNQNRTSRKRLFCNVTILLN